MTVSEWHKIENDGDPWQLTCWLQMAHNDDGSGTDSIGFVPLIVTTPDNNIVRCDAASHLPACCQKVPPRSGHAVHWTWAGPGCKGPPLQNEGKWLPLPSTDTFLWRLGTSSRRPSSGSSCGSSQPCQMDNLLCLNIAGYYIIWFSNIDIVHRYDFTSNHKNSNKKASLSLNSPLHAVIKHKFYRKLGGLIWRQCLPMCMSGVLEILHVL